MGVLTPAASLAVAALAITARSDAAFQSGTWTALMATDMGLIGTLTVSVLVAMCRFDIASKDR